MTEAGWTVCIECGMMCEAVEYHPYAACLMFKQCLNSEQALGLCYESLPPKSRYVKKGRPEREAR